MTSPEVIFTICRHTTASPYHILKSPIQRVKVPHLYHFLGGCCIHFYKCKQLCRKVQLAGKNILLCIPSYNCTQSVPRVLLELDLSPPIWEQGVPSHPWSTYFYLVMLVMLVSAGWTFAALQVFLGKKLVPEMF